MTQYFAHAFKLPQTPAMELARLVLIYGCALTLIAAGPHLPHFGF